MSSAGREGPKRSPRPARRRTIRPAVLLGGVRTPFARAFGTFESLSAVDLGLVALREALVRTGVAPDRLDHVVMGCGGMPSDAANPARVAALRAGVPHEVPALTVQRNCASGMEAVLQAARLVEEGHAEVVACGGMESMSSYAVELPGSFRRKALALRKARSAWARARALAAFRPSDLKPEWGLAKGLTDPTCGLSMGETAEVLARELDISRERQDAFAVRSHERASAARAEGRLAEEIAPVSVASRGDGRLVVDDDGIREDQSLEKLARLRPAFDRRHGSVTAGNSCGVTDGACALVVCSAAWAERHAGDREPLARIGASATAGVDPRRMGLGPAAALPRALAGAGWSLDDVEVLEVNEAFAAQVLAVLITLDDAELMRRHAGLDAALGRIDEALLNPNGGAIALGHPVGVSGARLVLTLALEMRRRGAARGAASLCVGGGQGQALLLERGE